MEILMTEDQSCDSSILVKCFNYKIQTLVEKKKKKAFRITYISSNSWCLLYHIALYYPFKDSHHSVDKIQSV